MKYCGFDVGKKSSVYCIVDEERNVVRRGKVRNRSSDLSKEFALDGQMHFALEACGKSFWIADELTKDGHKVSVVDPGKTKAIAAARIKHDRLDAKILATLCQADLMPLVDRPTAEERLRRASFVTRDGLVRARTKLMNLVRSIFDSEGFELPTGTAATFPRRARSLLELVPKLMREAVAPTLDALDEINAAVKKLELEIAHASEQEPTIARLQTVPGVGALTAACFFYTIRRPERFGNRRQVGAYLGLVPSLYQSGTTCRRGGITKQGHRATRWLLTQAAGVMLMRSKEDNHLRRWALALAERTGRKKAIVALARRLAEVLWSMWRHGRDFKPRVAIA